ncbi:hypothetical protein [Plantactinospora soyae]|uniref:Uncharacterized protein n=1 Tax=Plantactinospora soyae TaxID=1544732 RepID=A0A927M713_9ACTN|nr:hypothetical protein [Plantactinospora soyae]MBE1489348.1 hypothetical protein [Plantactinospora soyae]
MSGDRRNIERLTDEDFASVRRMRFGRLPARVMPADLIETAETDAPRDEVEQPLVRREWG